ncbi:MAG: YicC family protein [Peptostreptococcus sp.]|uniref:YicC/YloC family endoribonuclease n=1 Tax=Peptostreptococcus sp. TaxID=1262 RepID=UPI001CAD11E2|nr:YicC/YloC family endoribonuclease [Peptostreptococcus sp.]MBF1048417.1 YicC family protein [Peptostreptococcus sp.]MBF1056945.1 YicC family protein [Peptostreptococcus sp.]
MAKSMTGFGIGEFKDQYYNLSVECKTINHKYLDINPRIPRKLSFLEDKLRFLIKDHLGRGRVDIFVKFETVTSVGSQLVYDAELAKQYYHILKNIKSDFGLEEPISPVDIAKFPDVVKITEAEDDEEILWNMLSDAANKALENLCNMRIMEGKKLEKDILARADLLERSVCDLEKYTDTIEKEYKDKLYARISELLDDPKVVDEYRLAQEVAIYADKSNITEEIVRFKSHINQLRDTVTADESVGRKMDFLIQEMNREVNTMGSKSSDVSIANLVINMKAELEKIREQVQNIE